MKQPQIIILFLPLIFLMVACDNNKNEELGIPNGEGRNVILRSSQSETNSLEEYLEDGTDAETFTITTLGYKGHPVVARVNQNTADKIAQQNANKICNKIKSDSVASEYDERQNDRTNAQGMSLDETGTFSLLYVATGGTYFSSINCTSNE